MDNAGRVIKHKQFWNRTNGVPLKGYCYGSYFVSKRFKAVEKLLATPRKIQPDDFNVDDFADDYIRAYETCEDKNLEIIVSW